MDADMVAMFPKGIRALMIDDDTKFLTSATTLLSILNFDVVRCGSVAHALKSLMNGDLKGFDVILVHAANAATCGFDFRAIVETDLLIPVIYFLEEDHEATGDEADELLRTLHAPGSYVIKKPLDIDEVRTRLWMVIAFRKCDLENKASRGGAGREDEDRVHFKVVTKGRGRKRKGNSSSKHTGSSDTVGGHTAAKGRGKENVGNQQQTAKQNDGRAKKAQKNGRGEASNLPQPDTTTTNGQQQHVQHQPNPSDLSMNSFLGMLAVPPNNPKFFTSATVPSYNPIFFSGGTAGPSSNIINTTGGAPAAAPLPLMFGPFPYQGPPPPPVVQQDMLAAPAPAGDPFTGGMAGGGMTGGAPFAYGDEINLPFLQAPDLGAEQDGAKELAGTVGMDMYSTMAPPMAPQHAVNNVSDDAAMLELLLSDSFNNYSAVNSEHDPQPDDDLAPGTASSLNKLTAFAAGEFDQLAMEADGHKKEAVNVDTSFPLEALLGDLYGPMLELDDNADLEAMVGGGSTVADDAGAGTSLVTREGGGGVIGLRNLAGIDIQRDVWHRNDLPSPLPKNKNNVRD